MATVIDIKVLGVSIDLFDKEEERFYITSQLHDLINLETRDANFSKTIAVPLTPRNQDIFGTNIPFLDRYDDNIVRSIPCEVLIKGVPAVKDAFLFIGDQSIKDRLFEITIAGGTAKYFSQLSNDPISLLNLSSLDLDWTLANISAIAQNTTGITVARSIWYDNPSRRLYEANGGLDARTSLDKAELGEMGFFMFLATIVDKIHSNMGGLKFDLTKMDSLYYQSAFSVAFPAIHESFKAIDGTYEEVAISTTYRLFQSSGRIPYDVIISPGVAWDAINIEWLIVDSGTYSIISSYNGQILRPANANFFTTKFSGGITTSLSTVIVSGDSETVYKPFDSGSAVTANLLAGDIVRLEISYPSGTIEVFESNFSLEKQGAGRGNRATMSQLLPDISQRAFVKEVFKLFNIIPSENNGTIVFNYFEEIGSNPIGTLKFNTRLDNTIVGIVQGYATKNIVKYTDNEAVERTDSNGSFPVNSNVIDPERIKIESLFSATDDDLITFPESGIGLVIPNYSMEWQYVTDNKMTVQNGGTTYTTQDRNDIKSGDFISIEQGGAVSRRRVINVLTDFTGTIDIPWTAQQNDRDWDYWSYELNDIELHIVQIVQSTDNFTVWNGGDSLVIANSNLCQFEVLRWTNLLANYYQLLTDSMFKPFIVTGWVNIGVLEFIQIDGLAPLYVPEYQGNFYLNKLEQWKADGSAKVEIIQLAL